MKISRRLMSRKKVKKLSPAQYLAKKRKNRFITFVTLGYENDRYIDVVLWGCHKLSKIHCIMGEGEYEPEGHWIKVDKVKYDFLK